MNDYNNKNNNENNIDQLPKSWNHKDEKKKHENYSCLIFFLIFQM